LLRGQTNWERIFEIRDTSPEKRSLQSKSNQAVDLTQMKKTHKLDLEKRKKLEGMLHSNFTKKRIAEELGVNKTTIFRELKKCRECYDAEEAQQNAFQSKNLIDWEIIGKRFGLLTVLSYANKYKKRTWWNCICDCGKTCIISRKMLMDKCSDRRKLSCGCIPKQAKNGGEKVSYEESAHRKYLDLLRFRKIDNGCWNWTGYKQKNTPKTSWKNKVISVRRCIYLIVNGLEECDAVYSDCGNLDCFNPEHLRIGKP